MEHRIYPAEMPDFACLNNTPEFIRITTPWRQEHKGIEDLYYPFIMLDEQKRETNTFEKYRRIKVFYTNTGVKTQWQYSLAPKPLKTGLFRAFSPVLAAAAGR